MSRQGGITSVSSITSFAGLSVSPALPSVRFPASWVFKARVIRGMVKAGDSTILLPVDPFVVLPSLMVTARLLGWSQFDNVTATFSATTREIVLTPREHQVGYYTDVSTRF